MSQIDYALMIDRELKQYFLEHRNDVEAFHAYMEEKSRSIATKSNRCC
jgi:hypothetical protein